MITPFTRDDNTLVFINRGWVAITEKTWEKPEGKVTVGTVMCEQEKVCFNFIVFFTHDCSMDYCCIRT